MHACIEVLGEATISKLAQNLISHPLNVELVLIFDGFWISSSITDCWVAWYQEVKRKGCASTLVGESGEDKPEHGAYLVSKIVEEDFPFKQADYLKQYEDLHPVFLYPSTRLKCHGR